MISRRDAPVWSGAFLRQVLEAVCNVHQKGNIKYKKLTREKLTSMPRLHIDNLDTKILQMLVDNGRKPFLEIARECGVSGAAIHQRIAKLQATNILEGSRALIKPTTLGYDTCAFIGIFLKEPDKFNEVVERLKEVPEVVECHFTTGEYDMLIKIYARDNEHLLHLIHERLQPLGLMRTETLVSFREVFSRALPVTPKK
jgi:hypothetical protein BACCOPRO_02427